MSSLMGLRRRTGSAPPLDVVGVRRRGGARFSEVAWRLRPNGRVHGAHPPGRTVTAPGFGVAETGELTFSLGETRQLWSFLDGAIMEVDTRHHLWRSWGLCPRHSWAQAIIEIEERGGRPFGTSILYEDLTARAARLLRRTRQLPWPLVARRLRARDSCFTCDYRPLARSHGLPEDAARRERVNRLARSASLVALEEREWRSRSCPECLQGGGPTCRLHLLAGSGPADRDQLASAVQDLAERLEVFGRSMTWQGPTPTPAERASWIEALGWFAGWDVALRLAEVAADRG